MNLRKINLYLDLLGTFCFVFLFSLLLDPVGTIRETRTILADFYRVATEE